MDLGDRCRVDPLLEHSLLRFASYQGIALAMPRGVLSCFAFRRGGAGSNTNEGCADEYGGLHLSALENASRDSHEYIHAFPQRPRARKPVFLKIPSAKLKREIRALALPEGKTTFDQLNRLFYRHLVAHRDQPPAPEGGSSVSFGVIAKAMT